MSSRRRSEDSSEHVRFSRYNDKLRHGWKVPEEPFMTTIKCGKTEVDGLKGISIGRSKGSMLNAPKLLVFHGFPSAGRMSGN
jgi:hypothetical protein